MKNQRYGGGAEHEYSLTFAAPPIEVAEYSVSEKTIIDHSSKPKLKTDANQNRLRDTGSKNDHRHVCPPLLPAADRLYLIRDIKPIQRQLDSIPDL